MARVITERPRVHGMGRLRAKGYKKRLQRDGLDFVSREPITAMRGGTKSFTDVIGPLEGFLRKNCGRPWGNVCSEISAVLPAAGGVSLSHARDHLFEMVEEHTQIIDGEVCDSNGTPIARSWRHRQFYVDTRGVLRQMSPRRSYKRYRTPKVFAKSETGE
jgi:hypothetical protein